MDAITPVATGDEQHHDDSASMQHQPFFKKWGGLVVLSLALAIIIIDTTLLNVSLKAIINDLHTNLKNMQWVITIYSLILAAFTITGGRLGDLFGRKRMFLVGAVVFAIGSFIASISTNVGMMIAGEAIIEGIGAAMMMPATASLLITNFKGRDRSIAFGVWGGIAAASSAIGPILGGWLTTNYSWRWGFRINIVVVALVLLGSYLIKENHSLRAEKSKIDFVGIILSSLGLLSLAFGFIQASTYGWFKVKEQLVLFGHNINLGSLSATPLFLLFGAIVLALFVFWEKNYESKGKTPLLSLHLFQNKQFVAGASTMAVLALGQSGLFFAVPVFLQAVRHLDALHTGLTLLPMSISLLVAAPLSAFLIKFIRPKLLIQTGMSLSLISFIVMRASLSINTTALQLAPAFVLFGFGMGLIMAQVSNLTLSAVSPKEAGEASGVNNTLRMVGQTLGTAILGAILLSVLVSHVTAGIQDSKVIPENVKQFMEAGVQNHVSDISFGVGDSTSNNIEPRIKAELARITDESTVVANKTVMIYGMIFIFLGILVSTRLPNVVDFHTPAAGGETDAEGTDESETEGKETDEERAEDATGSTSEYGATYATLAETVLEPEQAVAASRYDSPASMSAPAVVAPPAAVAQASQANSRGKIYGGLILALVIIGGLIYANHTKNSKDTTSTPEVVTDAEPSTSSTANTNVNSNTNTDVIVPAPIITPAPAPAPTTPAPATPASENFSDPVIRFSFNKPSDWKIVKNSNAEIVFKAGDTLYNVQSSSAPNGDWDSLKTFLESRPGISNVRRTMFGSRDLFQFDISGTYQTGYAFLENGRLYYVLGAGSE
ncbi:MAG TPA: MFS transporter, partial [Patescibacteria group bacterium]|nr:MFS transporter [Patescibacteria group bacterium]